MVAASVDMTGVVESLDSFRMVLEVALGLSYKWHL